MLRWGYGSRGVGMVQKGNMRDPCGDEHVPYLYCVNGNILVVTLYYYFTKCYHSEKLDNRYHKISLLISYNCM